jgi:hypothetical protein
MNNKYTVYRGTKREILVKNSRHLTGITLLYNITQGHNKRQKGVLNAAISLALQGGELLGNTSVTTF